MLKGSIDERQTERARELRASGMTMQQVADELGVSKPTIHRWTTPGGIEHDRKRSQAWKDSHREETRAYGAQYDRDHRGTCTECGDAMGIGVFTDGICQPCRTAVRNERFAAIERMWNEGAKCGAIASAVGLSINAFRSEFGLMRATGWDLPYRRTPEQVARIVAGQRAAMERKAA